MSPTSDGREFQESVLRQKKATEEEEDLRLRSPDRLVRVFQKPLICWGFLTASTISGFYTK